MMTVHYWMIGYPTLYGFSGWITANGLAVSILILLIFLAHTELKFNGSKLLPIVLDLVFKVLSEGRGFLAGIIIQFTAISLGYILNSPIELLIPITLSLPVFIEIPIFLVLIFFVFLGILYWIVPITIIHWCAAITFGVLLMKICRNIFRVPQVVAKHSKKKQKNEEQTTNTSKETEETEDSIEEDEEDSEEDEDDDEDEDGDDKNGGKTKTFFERLKLYPKESYVLLIMWPCLDRFLRPSPERFTFLYYITAAVGIFSAIATLLVAFLATRKAKSSSGNKTNQNPVKSTPDPDS